MPFIQQPQSPDLHQNFAEGSESGRHQRLNENIDGMYLPMCRTIDVSKARWKRCS